MTNLKELLEDLAPRKRSTEIEALLAILNQDQLRGFTSINPEDSQRLLHHIVISAKKAISVLKSGQPLDNERYREIYALLHPLNTAFVTSCIVVPRVLPDFGEGPGYRVSDGFSFAHVSDFLRAEGLLGLRRLLQEQALDALRICENPTCKRWFLAKRSDQKSCTQSCRQKIYYATDAFKEARKRNYHAKKMLSGTKGSRHAKGSK